MTTWDKYYQTGGTRKELEAQSAKIREKAQREAQIFARLYTPTPLARYYYECHVTIEPVFDEQLTQAAQIAEKHFFRVADLLMQKRHEDLPTRSKFDTFMTGRHVNYNILQDRMMALVHDLQTAGFKVWRYKIEDTIIDSKLDDKLGLLSNVSA